MRMNTTELDSLSGDVTVEQVKPSWLETNRAMVKQGLSNGISTSAMNYEGDVFREQIDNMDVKFEPMKTVTGKHLQIYESYYKNGTIDNYFTGRGGVTPNLLKEYFATVEATNLKDNAFIQKEAQGNAAKDWWEAEQVLQRSDKWTAKLAGGFEYAMRDPLNIATLPFGGTAVKTATQGIIVTAGKAAMQEMAIATAIEPIIQGQQVNWSEQIGVNYGVKEAASNAALSILGAGAIRGTGSAAMDLTADGVKALRGIDPVLADEYQTLTKNNISTNVSEHIDNLQRTEMGEPLEFKEKSIEVETLEAQPKVKEFYEPENIIENNSYADTVAMNVNGLFPPKVGKELGVMIDDIVARSDGMFDASDMIPRIVHESRVLGKNNSTSTPYLQSNNGGETYGKRWTGNLADDAWNITQLQAERIYEGRATTNDMKALYRAVDSRLDNERELYEIGQNSIHDDGLSYDGDLEVITGKNEFGEDTYASYKDMIAAEDANADKYKRMEDCLL